MAVSCTNYDIGPRMWAPETPIECKHPILGLFTAATVTVDRFRLYFQLCCMLADFGEIKRGMKMKSISMRFGSVLVHPSFEFQPMDSPMPIILDYNINVVAPSETNLHANPVTEDAKLAGVSYPHNDIALEPFNLFKAHDFYLTFIEDELAVVFIECAVEEIYEEIPYVRLMLNTSRLIWVGDEEDKITHVAFVEDPTLM